MTGGWRIIQTLGKRVSEIQTPQGFAAGTSAATVILASSHLGFALSTTQVATGAIFGAGPARKPLGAWGVAGQIAWRGCSPFPRRVVGARRGVARGHRDGRHDLVAVVLIAAAAGIYVESHRRPITAHNVNDIPAPAPPTAAA